ncbi:hypothetical protein L208DRAFT_1521237 [Tricholoma matsutake]|nr:hypothetical protein L208DRAFT_1521237 [Tricholoma matsutake 945]
MPSDDDDEGRSAVASPLFGKEEEVGELWVTVKPRQSRSLDSLRKNKVKVKFLAKAKQSHNDSVLDEAEKSLTPDQRERIQKRNAAVRTHEGTASSCGEGTSEMKGKGPDPRNWGNAGIDPNKLDTDKQKHQYEYYNLKRKHDLEETKSVAFKEKKYKKAHNGPVPMEDLAPSGDENRKSQKRQTGSQKAKSRKEKEKARKKDSKSSDWGPMANLGADRLAGLSKKSKSSKAKKSRGDAL